MRGQLTKEIQAIAVAKLGREITLEELRLMPYVQHLMLNSKQLDRSMVSRREGSLLEEWKRAGWIGIGEGPTRPITITLSFWRVVCTILWEAYVCPEQ
jgi:hypothetical protein